MFVSFLHAKNPKHHLKNWSAVEKYVKQLIYTHKRIRLTRHTSAHRPWCTHVPLRAIAHPRCNGAPSAATRHEGCRLTCPSMWRCTLAHFPPLLLSSSALHGRKTSKKSPLLNMKSTLELVFTSFTWGPLQTPLPNSYQYTMLTFLNFVWIGRSM